jgi:menaquinone-dependent protoporphyrinogen oxidase
VDDHGAELRPRPTWLFSSGPLGDPPKPDPDAAVKIDGLLQTTGAREHHLFTGALDRSRLGLGERAIVRVVGAPDGDFRDWDDVRRWAGTIAGALGGEAAPRVISRCAQPAL